MEPVTIETPKPPRNPNLKPFPKGKSGNPGGRKKGSTLPARTRAVVEREMAVRDFAQRCVEDRGFDITLIRELRKQSKDDRAKGREPDRYTIEERLEALPYLEGVFLRMKLNMAPHLERFVLEHLWGKPEIKVKVQSEKQETPMAQMVDQMNADELQMFANVARRMIAARAESLIEGGQVPTQ
jgi:hypothetical protein